MRYIDLAKKILILATAALSISIVSLSNSSAASVSESYLARIAEYTYRTMTAVENLPTYFHEYAELAKSWMAKDDAEDSFTTKSQEQFAQLGQAFSKSMESQNSPQVQQQIMADMLGVPVSEFQGKEPPIAISLPTVNDLSYATLIGAPPLANANKDPYEYVKNASGFSYHHPIPDPLWEGKENAKKRYSDYFNTITAIQSYSAYLISQLGTDAAANPKVVTLQNKLINDASSSSWIAQIATQELGKVLRQILLFESQSYVLNTQIQQAQRQQIAATAMTNSLLILLNQVNENQMIRNAQGKPPGM
jgi:hypothetical protein